MKLDGIRISYGNLTIIDNCHLHIPEGEIFVLMGPSGSGKSTLLKGIAGLIPLEAGTISWELARGKTGLVFQEPRLFPHMTVLENLAFGLRAQGTPAKERNSRAREYLSILQLEEHGNRYPHQLSGGQQQRVSLGRVLVMKPDLLLLDEPFSSLDTPLRKQLTEWLYQLQRKQGFSILWVTHYMDEAYSVADKVGVIMDGNILQVGKPLDFYQTPMSERVAAFFSLPNRFNLQRWQEWIGKSLRNIDVNMLGWIPANALILQKLGEITAQDENCKIVWREGIVSRIKHEPKGYLVMVEVAGLSFEVELSVLDKIPNQMEQVRIGVPFEKIIWYPEN
ncbi:ABC transporter ATP-binding protein [Bacillus sp. DNRA2]|uniref:ABC transporter ATP-binding protein n=1 Tax=Bacillus sp. DNRA2 TaxID=2723053 RepID=UPI00145EBA78|nr:ABC transporter ATP-binding protein [Bacillus sp. DNRA2]NMD71369.1 ABC transporter ATP-binding protein [Bacillus sp. DNRA2]